MLMNKSIRINRCGKIGQPPDKPFGLVDMTESEKKGLVRFFQLLIAASERTNKNE